MKALKQQNRIHREGPVVLIILDGVGIGNHDEGDALFQARTPLLDQLMKENINTVLKAHGTAVGLPDDGDMGNSEVGHNALGAGRIFDQGAKLVNKAIETGSIYESDTWKELMAKPLAEQTTLHFMGLFSDGNVHSHIDQLMSMITRSDAEGVEKIRLHILLDGRDVPAKSSPEYIEQMENFLKEYNGRGRDYKIASGGGRMVTTMDRYEADWEIVRRGWEAHVLGTARPFKSAKDAVETFYHEDSSATDQYLPGFTIVDDKGPIGTIEDGDSVIFFNFRGDRSIEISRAFDDEDFDKFDRQRRPDVVYAGMMEYDGDLHIPKKYLVFPPDIDETMSEYLVNTGKTQFAISETQKFGHVTYFWNGNRSGKFSEKLEDYEEIPSDKLEFNERPWMKAAEITDSVINAVESGKYDFIRLNLANGDMVGHTGDLEASIIAAETLDLCLRRMLPVIEKKHGIALITADHGNLDEMFELDKKGAPKVDKESGEIKKRTSHTLNVVPAIIFDPDFNNEYRLADIDAPGLGNVAATLLTMMDLEVPEDYLPSFIEWVE